MSYKKLTIALGQPYTIHIGHGLIQSLADFSELSKYKELLVVTNDTIAPLYLDDVTTALGKLKSTPAINTLVIADGEVHKTPATFLSIIDELVKLQYSRQCLLIALGGGVIGDMVGFAASCYQRGVDFVQIPTTLLAQVDASVGGKTAVNHPKGKNLIGAFHQPVGVYIDTASLSTLPQREYQAGIAEVLKYGLIADQDFFNWLITNKDQLLKLDKSVLSRAIEHACQHKCQLVEQDEKEHGVRALLNLGHTFGHAIEAATGFGELLHGEAVAIGMVYAARLSAQLGYISDEEVSLVQKACESFGLPTSHPQNISPDELYQHMQLDKKKQDANIRFILLKSIGKAIIIDKVDKKAVLQVMV